VIAPASSLAPQRRHQLVAGQQFTLEMLLEYLAVVNEQRRQPN
jgi:hypothetical protein